MDLELKLKEDSGMHNLGATRSSLKPDHLLQTPDTFIRTPLPGATGVEFVIHAGPRLGAGFTQMTAEFAVGGMLAPLDSGIQRFIYVLDGSLKLQLTGTGIDTPTILGPGHFAFLPAGMAHKVLAQAQSRAVVLEKAYQPNSSSDAPGGRLEVVIGDEAKLPTEPLGGDDALRVRRMMPDGPGWDFAVNTMTYDPGAALAMVEVHIMEHGLLMLEGGGIYRLGDSWYPVHAGDFIWMAPYCPQWFGALGKVPAKYLIYKDWFRHPLS
jgi:(S)-ureidoglycine aminohydrolase